MQILRKSPFIIKKCVLAHTSRASGAARQTSLPRAAHPSERFLFNSKFRRNLLLNKISLSKYQTGSNYPFLNPTTLFQPFLISYTKISQSACYKYYSRVFLVIIRAFNLPYFSFFINIYGI